MSRFSLFIALITFVLSSMCHASEISIEGIIRGVNQARQTIQSGEIITITTTEYADKKSEEEIASWIKVEKEQRLKRFTPDPLFPDIDPKHFEKNYLVPVINIQANWERQRINEEHTTTIFRIMDSNTSGFPLLHHYKLTMVEEPGYSLDSEETQLFSPVSLSLLAYDTQTQVKEGIGDILLSSPSKESIIISDVENVYGYWHFSLFGRSPFRVPSGAQRVGKERLNGIECHIFAFTSENGQKMKIWIDVEKDFCVRNIEYHRHLPNESISARTVYKHFHKFGDVWFPKIREQTFYETDGTIQYVTKVLTTAAEFNVKVPLNFFNVNPDYYKNLVPDLPGMGLLPDMDNGLTEDAEVFQELILLCGPKSLIRICELLKVKTNLREIKTLSGFDRNRGTTMLGLKRAAAYKNLAPQGVRASVELLKRNKVPLPAIAYVNNNHFLVFESVDEEGVKISDPAQKYPPHHTWDQLSEIWSGELLIFDKTAHREGQKKIPLAFIEAPEHDFGKILGGSKIKHTFTIKNIGQKPLRILTVQETCDCAASVLSQDKILPGKTGDISAVLTVPSENRRVQESLRVFTDDPVQNPLNLTLKGEAFIPLNSFPNRIGFGNLKASNQNRLTKQISLHVQEGVQIQGVRTDAKHLTATIKTKDGIPYIQVQFLPILVGHFNNNILIDYTYQEKQATHNIFAFGQVLGDFNVTPNRLFFGLIKSSSAVSKTITISSQDRQPFQITSVESNTKAIVATLKKGEGEIQYQITTALNPEADPGELSGAIIIHTSSSIQPKVRVPFFGILSDIK